MSITAEFQEREFETYFNQELSVRYRSSVWSPGQTDEALLGFDGATFIHPFKLLKMGFGSPKKNRLLWKYFNIWKGKSLDPQLLSEWMKFADDAFPPGPINFFVQHKRPVQSSATGMAGSHWGQAYYEYVINAKQQQRLEKLENKLGSSGIVTYCGAAFMHKKDLWKYQQSQSIVENSNFVSAKKLSGHSRYTYINSGHDGFANSEPSTINDEPIIERLFSAGQSSKYSLQEQIEHAGGIVETIMREEDSNQQSLYFQLYESLRREEESRTETLEWLDAIHKVSAFNFVNSTSWSVISAPEMSD